MKLLRDFPGDYEAKLDALQDHEEAERKADELAESQHDAEQALHLESAAEAWERECAEARTGPELDALLPTRPPTVSAEEAIALGQSSQYREAK
jgi:hypothetical protein